MSTPLVTWVDGAAGSLFDVDNLPYAVFSHGDEPGRVGVRIGDHVLDLAPVAAAEMLEVAHVFEAPGLDPLLALGRAHWSGVRRWIVSLLTDESERGLVEPHLVPVDEVTVALPFEVADYVDFYCSLDHASNVGRIFRPDAEALLPNWRHLPVGYHGRAGTVVVSGTDVVRPCGQRKAPTDEATELRRERAARHRVRARLRGRRAVGRRAGECPPTRSPSTSSGCCRSTTGRPATSRPGSTSRSARSSASRSRPR